MSKNILITGGTGFIGSHLAETFIELGYNVSVFDRYNINNDYGWLENSKYRNELNMILGDIRDYDSVFKSMKGMNAVFHLAALIGIPYSYVSPQAYIRTNIDGTYNVLESAKSLGLDQILITSTSETYGTAQYSPIDENHPLVGQSPYSASKIAADHLSISYFRSFDLPVKIVRPFNTFGPRQSLRAIIPTIISQLLLNKSIELGSLSPTRDLTYVKDTCLGFFEIFESSNLFGEITNIGMNKEISIKDLALKISKKMKVDLKINESKDRIRPEKSEVNRLICDNSKIIEKTSWKPKFNLDLGLENTIDFIINNKINYSTKSKLYNV